MKKIVLVFFLTITTLAFSQQEASVWYFGINAGIKFNPDGTVTALQDSQMQTYEGCCSIADSDGNLLFYSDGQSVWDRNHVIMPNGNKNNGTSLHGDLSSTQSGIIVPNPTNPNIYYIFTVDEPHHGNAAVYPNVFSGNYNDLTATPIDDDGLNHGLNYSIIDLSVTGSNGSFGDVTSRNNHLITYDTNPTGEEIKYKCSEKITAVSSASGDEYWVITQFINKFYAFNVNTLGVTTNPVISNALPSIPISGYRRNALGYLKASSNGNKLVIAHLQSDTSVGNSDFYSGSVYTYDFNNSNGVVSNPVLVDSGYAPYGVEFSKGANIVYVSYQEVNAVPIKVSQYDLNSADIPNSEVIIHQTTGTYGALQMGINNKIYYSARTFGYLGVINNPDVLSYGCNFVYNGQLLATNTTCYAGLPPFITSFFNVAFTTQNVCAGESTQFTLSSNQNSISANWNFGDGTTSTDLNPNHTYLNAGTYPVTVTTTSVNGTATKTKNITIYALPIVLSNSLTLKQCDDNIDGFSNFNLNETIPLLVSNPTDLTFTFHESQADADANDNTIANFTAYSNQTVSNDIVFVRVENSNGCYKTAQINLVVATTLIPSSFQIVKTECDDTVSGSNIDGIATFDFSDATAQIQALYPSGQLLTVAYYKNVTDALAETNAITNTTNFTNTTSPNLQDIYVRVDSQVNNDCLGLGKHIKLVVERIPIIQPQVIKHCDDNQDGIYTFDTTNLQTNLLNGLTNVIVTYTSQNGTVLQSPFPNSFSTASQIINVNIKNNYGKQCNYATTIQFTVDDLPEIFGINTLTTTACDDEPFPNQQNGSYPFNTTNFQSTLLGNQAGMGLIVKYYDANNNPLPSPLLNPFDTVTQNVTVEIINPLNTTCKATAILTFVVNPVPKIELFGNELVCSNNPTFTKIINAGVLDVTTIANFTYQWFLNGVLIPNQTNYNLTVNTEGIYTVTVTNNLNCSRTRTLTVTASNTATVNTIEVSDLSNENSIVVLVSGQGDYQYSLDDETYQNSNEFYNLIPRVYTVYIRDKNGCGTVQEEVSILGIPKYFTPNGDGFNDFWNIKGVTLSNSNEALIYIFDRFGKLLKQISPIGQGWDGSYNGNLLPSEDYWYSIKLEDNRIFKGHFCLKR